MLDREWTSTAYILRESSVLLVYHKKLSKWLPAGGHANPGELPHQTAIREAYEETGWQIALYEDDPVEIIEENALSFPRPYLCLLEEILTPRHN